MGLLKGPRRAYTLVFQDSGIQVSSDQGKTYSPLSWSQVTQVYRRGSITYLYVGDHAYLLPHSQVQEGIDALWSLLGRHLPAGQLFSKPAA